MKTTLAYFASAVAMVVSFHAGASPAGVLPDATFSLSAGDQTVTTPITLSGTSCGGPGGGGCETSTASATTSLVLQTSGTGSIPWSTNPEATAVVYYEVVGGADISVPVTITGYGSTSLSANNGYSFASIDGDIGAPALVCTAINEPGQCTGTNPTAGTLTQSSSVTSNSLYEFVMQTGCEANGGTCSSYLDPTVSIDPTFLAANPGYSVELSPNITPATPPATTAAPEIDTASTASGLTLLLGSLLVLRDRRSTKLNGVPGLRIRNTWGRNKSLLAE